MQRHTIATTWGRAHLASSDMMSLETSRRLWRARQDPQRQTASIGIYSLVRDRWGIFHAQPIVRNEGPTGAASEGIVRQEKIEATQLAVETHGYTDFAMALGCWASICAPGCASSSRRHLFVSRGRTIPETIYAGCQASVDTRLIEAHWDSPVHPGASVMSGHASSVAALARFGSARLGCSR
jgi:TnpA family transposase